MDRFDAIFERELKDRTIKDQKNGDLETLPTPLLVAILKFSRLLVENCTNRSAYTSISVYLPSILALPLYLTHPFPTLSQRLVLLLQLDSFEIVEASLSVVLILLQRVKGSKAHKFGDLDQTLLVLAQNLGLNNSEQLNIYGLTAEELPQKCKEVTFDFFQSMEDDEGKETTQARPHAEGHVHLHLKDVPERDYISLFKDTVRRHSVPEKLWFSLFHKLRVSALIRAPNTRISLARIRFTAAAALCIFPPPSPRSPTLTKFSWLICLFCLFSL